MMGKSFSKAALLLVLTTGCSAAVDTEADAELASSAQAIAVAGSRIMRNQWVCNAGEILLGLDTSVFNGRVVCQAVGAPGFAPGFGTTFVARNAAGEAVCGGESGGGADQIAVGWQPFGPDAAHPTRQIGIYCRTLSNFTSGYNNTYAKFTTTSADLATPSHATQTFTSGGNEVSICNGVGYAMRGYTVKSINFGPGQNWLTGFYNCSH
jgi:hypothetical protein